MSMVHHIFNIFLSIVMCIVFLYIKIYHVNPFYKYVHVRTYKMYGNVLTFYTSLLELDYSAYQLDESIIYIRGHSTVYY